MTPPVGGHSQRVVTWERLEHARIPSLTTKSKVGAVAQGDHIVAAFGMRPWILSSSRLWLRASTGLRAGTAALGARSRTPAGQGWWGVVSQTHRGGRAAARLSDSCMWALKDPLVRSLSLVDTVLYCRGQEEDVQGKVQKPWEGGRMSLTRRARVGPGRGLAERVSAKA